LGPIHPIGPAGRSRGFSVGLDTLLAGDERVLRRLQGIKIIAAAPLLIEMSDAGYLGRKTNAASTHIEGRDSRLCAHGRTVVEHSFRLTADRGGQDRSVSTRGGGVGVFGT